MLHPQKPCLIANNLEFAGLGNRIRFTLSALSLAKEHGREFQYYWPQSKVFEPALTDLWLFDESHMDKIDLDEMQKSWPSIQSLSELPSSPLDLPVWHFHHHDALPLNSNSLTWGDRLRQLSPVEHIAESIKKFWVSNLIAQPYIGVMIRAHSRAHSLTAKASPVEWYITRMKELSELYPGIRFFISCDVPEVQKKVMEIIPSCCGQMDKGGYNTQKGIESSVIDLYLLASASYLLVPHYSSFPAMAWELANRRIISENSQKAAKKINILKIPIPTNPLKPSLR